MCGCLAGTLPQVPQQNVFLGLPLELMTEEAALLVERGAAYIVDDREAHKQGLKSMMERDKEAYLKKRTEECDAEAVKHMLEAEERKRKFAHQPGYKKVKVKGGKKDEGKAEKKGEDLFDFAEEKVEAQELDVLEEESTTQEPESVEDAPETVQTPETDIDEPWNPARLPLARLTTTPVILPLPTAPAAPTAFNPASLPLFGLPTHLPTTIEIPTTTNPAATTLTTIPVPAPAPTPPPPPGVNTGLLDRDSLRFYPVETTTPTVFHSPTPTTFPSLLPSPSPASFPVYKYLQNKGYFLSPGLRFGCQFMAYPGDPLRFHSHFVVRGLEWDEEIDVLDVIGGGRLGTGVKKAWMIGGTEKKDGREVLREDGEEKVRAFCVEWGGF